MKILEKSNWKAFNKILKLKPEDVIKKIKKSRLTGRGGANFPTGIKWEITKNAEGKEKYLICNAHESEPGTFKDRFIIQKNPENLIEGIAIASYAIGINKAFIYLKHEYSYLRKNLERVIEASKNKLKKINLEIEIIKGAGAYICGETTAIIDSIEGLRGEPRKKPPYPSEKGLFRKPTCVNNVETLANVPLIFIDNKWDNNLRLFSVSGNIKKPGVYELPLGFPINKLLSKVEPYNKVKALYFGCAGGCIPPEGDLGKEEIKNKGAMLGNCSIIVVDNSNDIVDIAKNIVEFFVHESCGKCTPCREGTYRVLEILEMMADGNATKKELALLEELSNTICETSFCGLGKVSTLHLKTALKYFREDFEEKCKSQ
jgi:NADH:ubiquinone oxidoreductase subunit F (NADH-binding)